MMKSYYLCFADEKLLSPNVTLSNVLSDTELGLFLESQDLDFGMGNLKITLRTCSNYVSLSLKY